MEIRLLCRGRKAGKSTAGAAKGKNVCIGSIKGMRQKRRSAPEELWFIGFGLACRVRNDDDDDDRKLLHEPSGRERRRSVLAGA